MRISQSLQRRKKTDDNVDSSIITEDRLDILRIALYIQDSFIFGLGPERYILKTAAYRVRAAAWFESEQTKFVSVFHGLILVGRLDIIYSVDDFRRAEIDVPTEDILSYFAL